MADPPKSKFIDFTMLPPHLQLKLWVLGLDADTSAVAITYKPGQFTTALKYDYGGAATASLAIAHQQLSLSLDPSTMKPEAKLVLKGFDFDGTVTASKDKFQLTLGWGTMPLPSPVTLTPTFDRSWSALTHLASTVPNLPLNPVKAIGMVSDDVGALGDGAKAVQGIAKADPKKITLGAGLNYTYTPASASGPGGHLFQVIVGGSF